MLVFDRCTESDLLEAALALMMLEGVLLKTLSLSLELNAFKYTLLSVFDIYLYQDQSIPQLI